MTRGGGAPRAALALALGVAGAAGPAPGAEPPEAAFTRWHFDLPGTPPLAYSVHFRRGPDGDATRLLVELDGERLVLVSRQDRSGRDTTESVRRRSSGEELSRRLVLPGAPYPPECARVEPPDACLVLAGRNGRLATSLAALSGADAAQVRLKAQRLVSPELAASLARLAAQSPRTYELDAYGDDFLALVWPGVVPPRTEPPSPGTRGPGCLFDAAFGFPCSAAERSREEARSAGR